MSYLATHGELVGLLLDARPHLEKFFGHDVQIELRLADGIELDRTGELLAMVQSHLDADPALELIGRFWDDWWKENSARSEAWPLYIDVEYAGEPRPSNELRVVRIPPASEGTCGSEGR